MENTAKNVLIMQKNLQQMQVKLLHKEATWDLIGNKIADRNTKVSKNSQQNYSEIVTNEHDKEIPKERYIFLSRRTKKIMRIK